MKLELYGSSYFGWDFQTMLLAKLEKVLQSKLEDQEQHFNFGMKLSKVWKMKKLLKENF